MLRIRTVAGDDGVRLTCRDHGGTGHPLLLLHGLAGHAAEWDALAALLLPTHRVIAYDARGHGASTRRPPSVTRAAYIRDAMTVATQLSLSRPTLIGQSLGGHTAMLTAAAHPDLVRSLILIEAGPRGPSPELPAKIAGWLKSWPTPFPSLPSATAFFGGGPAGRAWAEGLAEHPDGLRTRFDPDVMIASVAENAQRAFWPDWDRVRCPTLVVRGADGWMPDAEAAEMRTRRPETRVEIVGGAAHDVHLDNPQGLYEAMAPFLHL